MTEVKNREVLATTHTSESFKDFLVAIKGVLPSCTESYGINKSHQVEDEFLDYCTAAKKMQRKSQRLI